MNAFCTAVLAFCAVVLAAASAAAVFYLRRVCLQINSVVPAARSILERTDRAVDQVGGVVHKACRAADGLIDQVDRAAGRARSFFGSQPAKKQVNRRRIA